MQDDGVQLFESLERAIQEGPSAFVAIGLALLAIKQGRRYRALGYATFSEFARSACGMSPAYAYRTIGSARVMEILRKAGCSRLPANESQARELAPLEREPDALVEVWSNVSRAVQAEPVTASAIRQAVAQRR